MVPLESNNTPLFHLESHPTARSRAVAASSLVKGTVVLSTPPIATVLLDSAKGRRCDTCLRARLDLRRCTACKNYWYCDLNCQMIAWKAHHRRLCKRLLVFTSSSTYEGLTSSEKLHSLLLSHLLAEHAIPLSLAFIKTSTLSMGDLSDPISTMLSLLPQRNRGRVVPALILEDPVIPELLMTYISSRFANNNFTIHCARSVVFAHGVFPSASRSFNHSCVPSAVPVYRHARESRCITMEIRLLRDMKPGEEITIPYMDPALPHFTRQSDLQLNYGFQCECPLCSQVHLLPSILPSPTEIALWEADVREKVLPSLLHEWPSLEVRRELLRTWHPSYLPLLAEEFGKTSHDGPYDLAMQKGAALLAVYIAVYPPNFPMIGLHALELAKTCWNSLVTGVISTGILQSIDTYLTMAERIFCVLFGSVAEEEGPQSEVKVLRTMLRAELDASRGP